MNTEWAGILPSGRDNESAPCRHCGDTGIATYSIWNWRLGVAVTTGEEPCRCQEPDPLPEPPSPAAIQRAALGTNGFAPLTGHLVGGEPRKQYDAKRKALYAYLDSHEIDPELRRLIDAMEDEVYDFAGEGFNDGVAFATVTERFRAGLLELGNAK